MFAHTSTLLPEEAGVAHEGLSYLRLE